MELYTIKGADGNDYGPVDAQTIRQWVTQARANSQTMARRGNESFKPLSEFMEFAHDLGLDAPTSPKAQAEDKPKLKMKAERKVSPSPEPVDLGETTVPQEHGFTARSSSSDTVSMLMSPLVGVQIWFKIAALACLVYTLLSAGFIYYFRALISFDFVYLPTFAFFHLMLPGISAFLFWRISSLCQTATYSNDEDSAINCQENLRSMGLLFGIAGILFLCWTAYAGYEVYDNWEAIKMVHMMVQQQIEQGITFDGGGAMSPGFAD